MNNNYIAVIIEGGAEKSIINVLLDHHLLKFDRNEMLEEDVIRERNGRTFAREHLTFGFQNNQISILRILDSHNEKFKIPKAYQRLISSITNLYTSPEIEMLFIVSNGDFDAFKNRKADKSGKKLSAHNWCKSHYKNMNNLKSPDFVYDYWNNQPDELVRTIKLYSRKCNYPFQNTLASILK
ncbi:N-6 DNA methylase [Companilactobacillus halodurans]|uniref:N-6 DNA methylase n=1 Tax=Companilactobacillus halodurans TaxID=2584183 RepID=A0A5P0ZU90_9LACO|nr:N-6 DNA methylase [Companilactobacillus halodurans]MQS76298.1 N-6 DNA methylase [Companilactobacillus halodurans]MQS96571.1 N-6 DNA methylase [Companilactobacillus halodurans]